MKRLLIILTLVSMTGCAHKARVFTAPDHAKLGAAQVKLAEKVMQAKATAARASVAVKLAKLSSDKEGRSIALIVPRVETLLRMSPAELRPEVEALKGEVATLQAAHAETVSNVKDATKEQGVLTGELEQANAAKNDVAKSSPEYLAEVEKQTERLNIAEAAWQKDSLEIVKLKTHSILYRIAAVLGLLALAGLAFLYFTGKIAKSGAEILR